MDAPQYVYVHADVPWDIEEAWMFYYTHYRDMYTPQYVQVDVLSDYLCPWMFYYKHHSNMDAPQYVHVDVPWDFEEA
jgi:hypothetical protein